MKSFALTSSLLVLLSSLGACSSDDTPSSGAQPSDDPADGGSSADGGGPTDGGDVPPDGGSVEPNPEPTCTPVTGAPTWTFKDQPIAGWIGNRDKPLDPQILGIAGLAYGNGTWVALAKSQSTPEVTWATSTDAATWTVHTGPVGGGGSQHSSLGFVHFDGQRFLFFGTNEKGTFAYTSTDGQSFTATKVDDQALPLGVVASDGSGGVVVAGSNGYMVSTTDGTTWARRTPEGGPPGGYLDIAFGAGKYVATDEPLGAAAVVSSDGVTFTKIANPIFNGTVTFGAGAFHARGNGKLVTSTDGTTWTEETLSGTGVGSYEQGKLYYLAGRWLVQHVDGTKATSEFGVSADAKVWSEYGKETVGLPTPAGRGVQPLGMAYGGCHYIAYGNYWNTDATQAEYMIVATVSPAE